MSTYNLNLFGGFDLSDDQGAAITIRSKKGRCLLAYLALGQGQKVSRDVLAALLWGERGDTQARRSLSQELYRLRGLFPEDVQDGFVLEAESVALKDGLFEVDVVNFERGLESGDAEAAALYGGELLAGLGAGSEGFDDWLRAERERLRESAIHAGHQSLRAHMKGAPEQAIESASRLLSLDPTSEEAHRALMQLHSRAGRRDLALKQYEKCRALLAEELGIEPDAATQALYEKIKTNAPAAPNVETPEPAPAAAEKAAERRQVTVMACGLVLESPGRGALDPEDRGEITRICRDVTAALLARNGSRIARTMGDSFLAYFGYPEAREDDAERAARAGLEIVKEIGGLDLQADVAARCRVGIASGLVIAGEGEEETLAGEAPDRAARLLQAAEPGMVVVSEAARELLASAFTLEALEGGDAPETAWLLSGEAHTKSRFEAHRMGALTPFVGRELELQNLFHRWGQAEEGEGQVVLISGEPGIGKSRIAETIHQRLPEGGHIRLLYQCSPHHTNSALYPVIEQLKFAAEITATMSAEERLDRLESLIAKGTDEIGIVAPLFADLLSIPVGERYPAINLTPQARKERTLEALVAQLVGLAAHTPVLFVFEDLHWADPTTREFLDLTLAGIGEARVLALLTFRPEYEAPWVGQSHATVMAVNRLSKRLCGEMAQSVAAEMKLPDEVLNDIVAKTDGVPLFVEELTKTILGGDSSETVPATIQASLTARLDRLGPAREVAQVGAVIGRSFTYELLGGVSKAAHGDIDAALIKLEEAGLAIRRGSPPHATYTFKHALVQDAAYESLLKSARRSLHARVAEVMEETSPGVAETQPELLAHHYTEAGLTERALDYWQRAGQRALERSAHFDANAHAERGLSLLDAVADEQDRGRREIRLQNTLGAAVTQTRGYAAPEAGRAFRRALELCEALHDTDEIFTVLFFIEAFHLLRAEFTEAWDYAKRFYDLGKRLGDPALEVAGLHLMALTPLFRGQLHVAKGYAEALWEIHERAKPPSTSARFGEESHVSGRCILAYAHYIHGYLSWSQKIGQGFKVYSTD